MHLLPLDCYKRFQSIEGVVKGKAVKVSLIARRSMKRAGEIS